MGGLEARNCIDYFLLAVTNASALGLSSATPALSNSVARIVATIENDQVRYREDGTPPTTTEGILLNDGDELSFMDARYHSVLRDIKFIAVSANVNIRGAYYD